MAATSSVAIVRHSQRAISRDFVLKKLADYLARDAFQEAAVQIVQHYFPRAVNRGNDSNIEILTELYLHALVLAPLIYRMPGAFRPDWSTGTVLSWFRNGISQRSQQWFVAEIDAGASIHREADLVRCRLRNRIGIRDDAFVDSAAAVLCNLSASTGRKADAARLFLDPFCCALDDEIVKRFSTQKCGATRRTLRAQLNPIGSYFRRLDRGFLLADINTMKQAHDLVWKDIREEPIWWEDYRISWDRKIGHLRIELNRDTLAALLREAKDVMRSKDNPHSRDSSLSKDDPNRRDDSYWRLTTIDRLATAFFTKHRYATGSLSELQQLDYQFSKLVRRKVTATHPSMKYSLGRAVTYDALVKPMTNPFLTTDAKLVSNATWMHFWNPYR